METTTPAVDLSQLTQAQIDELVQKAKELEKAKKQAVKAQRNEYKALASKTTKELYKPLRGLSQHIKNVKKLVFDSYEAVIELKEEIYGVKEGQQSHTFTDDEGGISIKIGYRVTDAYDDTFSVGMKKVNNYIGRLAGTTDSEALKIISYLLKTDAKGNLKPSRVLELRQYANEVHDEELSDGVHIIEESYKPTKSCLFVEVKYKDKNNKWLPLPLSISAFDMDEQDEKQLEGEKK